MGLRSCGVQVFAVGCPVRQEGRTGWGFPILLIGKWGLRMGKQPGHCEAGVGCSGGVVAEPGLPTDDNAHFRKRGSLLWNQQDGTLSLSQRQLNEEERGRLRVRRGPGLGGSMGDMCPGVRHVCLRAFACAVLSAWHSPFPHSFHTISSSHPSRFGPDTYSWLVTLTIAMVRQGNVTSLWPCSRPPPGPGSSLGMVRGGTRALVRLQTAG